MHRLLPLLVALPSLALPGPAAAKDPSKPVSSIPGAQVGDRVHAVSERKGMIYTARFVADGALLLGLDAHLRRIDLDEPGAGWQVPMPNRTRVIRPPPGQAKQVLVGTDDGRVQLHALADGRLIEVLPGPRLGWISGIAVSADGRDITAVSLEGAIQRWRDREPLAPGWPARPGKPTSKVAAEPGRSPMGAPDPPRASPFPRLEAAAFSPEGLLVLAGNGGDRIALGVFDQPSLSWQAQHRGPRSGAPHDHWQYGQALAFSPDGRFVAVGYWGGGLELLSWPDLQTRWATELDDSWIARIRWAGNDRLWAVGATRLFAVRATDGASAQQRQSAPNHALDAFDLSPDRRTAALGPRMTGVVLTFPTDVIGDWAPPRFARPKTPVAVPPALAPGADPCIGVRCPSGFYCERGSCSPIH